MAEAASLFWSFGSMYFNYLGQISVFGVSVLCYILGAWLVSQVISMLIRTGRSVKVSFRSSTYRNINEYHHYIH